MIKINKNILTILAITGTLTLSSCGDQPEITNLGYTPEAIGDNNWTKDIKHDEGGKDEPTPTPPEGESDPKDPYFAGTPVSHFNKNYVGTVSVEIDGNALLPSRESVTIMATDGTHINFALKNFILNEEDTQVPVGTVRLQDVELKEEADGTITLRYDKDTQIIHGDPTIIIYGEEIDVPEDAWLGPMLPLIPIKLVGTLKDGVININIDINMEATLGQIINVNFNTK